MKKRRLTDKGLVEFRVDTAWSTQIDLCLPFTAKAVYPPPGVINKNVITARSFEVAFEGYADAEVIRSPGPFLCFHDKVITVLLFLHMKVYAFEIACAVYYAGL